MAEFAEMIESNYSIKRKGTTVQSPQANAVLENLWAGILPAMIFAIRATYHTTLQATPMQLVFERDSILKYRT
jgi:hypothetical protein